MIKKIPSEGIYTAEYGWHTDRYHFAYGDYDDPDNSHFGVLRALNEFVLDPESGFDTHPHSEMEIISYCVEGELTHGDSLGHSVTLESGDVQYLSAGSGITHHEMNESQDRHLRFYQIWITPQSSGLPPQYECKHFSKISNQSNLQHIVSGDDALGVIRIAQDANIYAARMGKSDTIVYTNWADRQSYLVCLVGKLTANGINLRQHDALKIIDGETLNLVSLEDSHLLLIEMAKEG